MRKRVHTLVMALWVGLLSGCLSPSTEGGPQQVVPVSGNDVQNHDPSVTHDVVLPSDVSAVPDVPVNTGDVSPVDSRVTPQDTAVQPGDSQPDVCVPNCNAKQCGDDGCGGSCGTCPNNTECIANTGVCSAPNPPAGCEGKQCGDDGNGGSCGTCPKDQNCEDGLCVCTPNCFGKQCGNDGCGGECGTCPGGQSCQEGLCVCVPNCFGKQCGNDGCGGACGTCPKGQACNGANCVCQPNCAGKSCGDNGCGGSCGSCPGSQSCNGNQCEGPVLPSISFSANPATAKTPFLVWIKDTVGWAFVDVKATGPCGTSAGQWQKVTETDGVFTWEYMLTAPAAGQYTVSFTAENGAKTIVSSSLSVNGDGDCVTPPQDVCSAAGAACTDVYPENKVCPSTGVSKVVICHKFGTCSAPGNGTLCSWGPGSYCDDPCKGQGPTAPPDNAFGIGLVGPGDAFQLDLAHDLAGDGGKVLLIFAGVQKSTTGPDASWISGVQGAYDRNLVPVVRIGPPWGKMNIRSQSDDNAHKHYKGLAEAYKAVVKGLPLKAGWPLYVQIHNEPNLCYEWVCDGGGTLGAATIAAEYAAFFRDVADAIHAIGDPRIKVSLGALAPGGNQQCNCCGNGSCGGAPGWTGLQFLDAMKAAVPDIWTRLDFLASHAYPASNIGWGFFLPFGQSKPGLKYFEQELAKVGPGLEVMITETGWSTQRPEGGPFPTEQQKADWTVQAYQEIWLTSPSVKGVMPFVLLDAYWGEKEGFGWVHLDGSHYPVFDAVRKHRCSLGLGPC